ncbi:hypothetical protein BZL41_10785 [Pseudomonas sp. PIC25]|uniref:hypothetical protein n=1 Tax=Pseudomonas sp. PIC25 TaxID=1958773 RepID=UPI000BABE850|nr:hypothetical protein [Pseudomonas sp. PIC25]PAU64095.1 hypothetical protein BZL41_10785 [Pseudomonas sp. PIC25]
MTTTPLDIDAAMKLASEAFQPYGCVTSANPEDDSFGFTVMSSAGAEVLAVPHVPRTQYANPLRLCGVIEQARLDLLHKGCHLDPWTMPYITDPSAIPETPPNY